jgi:hypothetical protein
LSAGHFGKIKGRVRERDVVRHRRHDVLLLGDLFSAPPSVP